MEDSVYVLDANVLIEAKRRYYAFDLVPDFWKGLIWHANAGRIRSIDRVRKELERGSPDDELLAWANNCFRHAFAPTNGEDVVGAYRALMKWSFEQDQFLDAAKAEFAVKADAWLLV